MSQPGAPEGYISRRRLYEMFEVEDRPAVRRRFRALLHQLGLFEQEYVKGHHAFVLKSVEDNYHIIKEFLKKT